MAEWIINAHSVTRANEVLRGVSIWSSQDRPPAERAYYVIEVGIGTEDGKFDVLGTYDGSRDGLVGNQRRPLAGAVGVARRLPVGATLKVNVVGVGNPELTTAGLTVEWTLALAGGNSQAEKPLFATSGFLPDARVRAAVDGLTERLNNSGVTEWTIPVVLQDPYPDLFIDAEVSRAFTRDGLGQYHGKTMNASTASQGFGNADEYVDGSAVQIPSFGLQTKMVFVWRLTASKTAASTATPVYTIRVGFEGALNDAAILALTGPAQTAVADTGSLTVMATLQVAGAAGSLQGMAWWNRNGTVQGFANNSSGAVQGTSAAFDTAIYAGAFAGLSIHSGALSDWTVTQVFAEMSC